MKLPYEGKFNKRKFAKNFDKRTVIQNEQKEFVSSNNSRDKQNVSLGDKRFQSVVVIRNPNDGLGTGFYIAKNIIITNSHVVEGSNFVDIELRNGTSSFGKVIKSDSDLDIALIRVEASGRPVSFANKFQISIGERADVIGHPRGLTFSLTRGIVSAVRTMWGNKYIQTV